MNRPRTPRWVRRTALACASVLFVVSMSSFVASTRGQAPSSAPGSPAVRGANPDPGSGRDGPGADQPSEALEALEVQLEAKRALLRIDEARAEQAKRWRAYYEKLTRDGKVPEDRLLAATDDVLMMDAHILAERADLKAAEIRTKFARLHAAAGNQPTSAVELSRKELDVLEALLEGKRTLLRVGEARAERARKAEAHCEKLFRDGMATEDEVIAAKDDVLLMDSILAWGRASVKLVEGRVKSVQREGVHGGPAADGLGRRLAELEERLAMSEMKADVLQHEVGRLRRELPRETHGAR